MVSHEAILGLENNICWKCGEMFVSEINPILGLGPVPMPPFLTTTVYNYYSTVLVFANLYGIVFYFVGITLFLYSQSPFLDYNIVLN